MKVVKIKYDAPRFEQYFYTAKNENELDVKCYVFTPENKKEEIELYHLEYGIWKFHYHFKLLGKYLFVFFEGSSKELVLIVMIN